MTSKKARFHIPFGACFGVGAALAIGVQAALYLLVLENTIGSFYLFHKPKPAQAASAREFYVALLHGDRRWEQTLQQNHIPFRVIADGELRDGIANRFGAIVLPSVACMGESQRQALSRAVASGLGMVASGPLAARDADGSWRGWDYLTEMTGLRAPKAVTVSEPMHAAFRGQRYFSAQVPAGFNMEVPAQEFVTGEAEQPDLYWADWKLRPAQGGTPAQAALAVHRTRGRGRVVWIGLTDTVPTSAATARGAIDHYLVSSVRWAGRQPMAAVGDWPNRTQAAVLIAEDVVDPENAVASAALLESQRVPVTFFCSSAARGKSAMLKRLRGAGEVASSGDSADPFGEQQDAIQTERLVRVKRELESADASIRVTGFNPPQGSANDATLASLASAGYRYYFDASEAHRAVPELLPAQKAELARIYLTASDDFEIVAKYRGPTPWGDDLADGFLREFRRMAYVGGIYPLIFRSDLLGARENLHILKTIVAGIKADPVWMTSGQDLVRWWSQREKIRVDLRRLNSHRMRLSITNQSRQELRDASVYVYLPYRPEKFAVHSVLLSLQLPHAELAGDDDVLRLDLPPLGRDSSQVLLIALDEAK